MTFDFDLLKELKIKEREKKIKRERRWAGVINIDQDRKYKEEGKITKRKAPRGRGTTERNNKK